MNNFARFATRSRLRKQTATGILLLTALIVVSVSCGSKQVGGDVAATVDGRKIFTADVEKYYLNQTAGSDQQPPAGEQATNLRLNILRELIDNEILMHRAEKLGLLATDDEVDRKLNEIKSPYTQDQFNQQLAEKKITLDDFKRDIRRSLTVDKVMNKEITSKINVTDQDISSYYNAHKSEFNLVEPQYHLAQIFVSPVPNPQAKNQSNKAQNEGDARKKIQMVMNRLDSGDDFGTLAMNFSEDTQTASNGGDLGFTPESALQRTDPTTRDTIARLKPGQYSTVITIANPANKQVMGFRIVKLISREPAGQRELSDPRVQETIRSQLRDRREQLLKAAYYEVLRDQAKVENYLAEKVLADSGTAKP